MTKLIHIIISLLLAVLSVVSGAVVDLTDATFEHQTQASTGQVREVLV
jgi:hypothetical protein